MSRVLEGLQMSFNHSPHPGFKLHNPREETERNGSTMPDRLRGLVEMIIWSLPVKDPHVK